MWIQVNKETKRIEAFVERCNGFPIAKNKCDLIEVDHVPKEWPYYKYIDNEFKLDEEYMLSTKENELLRDIRVQRELECFSYINRGVLWYETLTIEQKNELKIWYQNWLDAPQTREIPSKPTWLI